MDLPWGKGKTWEVVICPLKMLKANDLDSCEKIIQTVTFKLTQTPLKLLYGAAREVKLKALRAYQTCIAVIYAATCW